MALTDERLDSLLAYCKLTDLKDDPEVETLIPLFYEAAVSYMDGAGVSTPTPGTPRAAQYDLLINAMVLDAWDHRDTKEPVSAVTDNVAFRRSLTQMKLTEGMVSDLDTSP